MRTKYYISCTLCVKAQIQLKPTTLSHASVCVCVYIYILCIQKKVCKSIKPGDLEIWLQESFWKEGVHLDE